MRKIKEDVWLYKGHDVFYSPDEGGYYAVLDNKVSKLYKSRENIKRAIDKNAIKLKPS